MKEFRFMPLEQFEWWVPGEGGPDQLIGQYIPGMTYNCTADSRHDALRAMCKVWEKRGRIQILALLPGQRFILNTETVEV
jgi:hypothetical protein